MLQLSVKSIYRLVASDPTMPATKIGGSVRFHRERLERWLRTCEQGAPRTRSQVLAVVKSRPSGAAPGACADPCADGGRS